MLDNGAIAGYPMQDVRVTVYDGKYHSVDSSEMSFKMAGSVALRTAIEKVGVHVLEPVSEIHVHVPASQQGEVLGDLNSRRGQILGTDTDGSGEVATVNALVPTAEIVHGVPTVTRTRSAGRFTVATLAKAARSGSGGGQGAGASADARHVRQPMTTIVMMPSGRRKPTTATEYGSAKGWSDASSAR